MSSNNPSLNQRVQIGAQPDFTTHVASTKVLKSLVVELDPQIETDAFFPSGNIFPTSNDLTMEWSEADISGILTYTEIVYLLTMALGPATITTPGGGTLSRQWKWTIRGTDLLSPTFFSLEKGNAVYALGVDSVIATGFNFGWRRQDRVEVGGSAYGKRLTGGITLTGGLSPVEIVRVLPQQIDIYADNTYAGKGTTLLGKAFEGDFSLDGLFGGVWPLNSSLTAHDGIVPLQPDSENSVLLMANSASLQFLTDVRAGTKKYMTYKATGPIIEAAIPYSFRVDVSAQVKDVDGLEDSDGVYAVPVSFQPIDDGTNPTVEITVVNKQTAL